MVDSSSFFFYRVFATLSWWNRAKPDNKINLEHTDIDEETDRELRRRLIDQADKHLCRIERETGVPTKDMFLFRDCPRADIWRMEVSSSYKGNRMDNNPYGKYIKFLTESFSFADTIRTERAEADDVIAYVSLLFKRKKPDIPQYIVSGDSDLAQLEDTSTSPHIRIINPRKRKRKGCTLFDTKKELLKKIVKGDSSDAVTAVGIRINIDKLAEKVQNELMERTEEEKIEELETRIQKLLNSEEKREKFNRNRRLVDFNYIPEEVCKHIHSNLPASLLPDEES